MDILRDPEIFVCRGFGSRELFVYVLCERLVIATRPTKVVWRIRTSGEKKIGTLEWPINVDRLDPGGKRRAQFDLQPRFISKIKGNTSCQD